MTSRIDGWFAKSMTRRSIRSPPGGGGIVLEGAHVVLVQPVRFVVAAGRSPACSTTVAADDRAFSSEYALASSRRPHETATKRSTRPRVLALLPR